MVRTAPRHLVRRPTGYGAWIPAQEDYEWKEKSEDIWVMSMGHFMGLFDGELWGMRPTGKVINIRYTEFHCVKNSKITKTGMFCDSIAIMEAAGMYPLAPSSGQYFVYHGPLDHDGRLLEDGDPKESRKTFEMGLTHF